MIVVDTQLLIYLSTPSPFASLAEAVVRRDAEWHCPALWRSEFRNVLAGSMRRGEASAEDALRAFAYARDRIAEEHLVDTADILALIQTSRCSAYDLEFVAVAQALNARLVTNDKQVLADFPTLAISAQAFAA